MTKEQHQFFHVGQRKPYVHTDSLFQTKFGGCYTVMIGDDPVPFLDDLSKNKAEYLVGIFNCHEFMKSILNDVIEGYNAHEDGYARQVLRPYKEKAEKLFEGLEKGELNVEDFV